MRAIKCQISIIFQMVDIANGALILRFFKIFLYFFCNIFVCVHSFTGILMKHIICATFKTRVGPERGSCLKTSEGRSMNFCIKKIAKSKTQRQLRFAKSPYACFIFAPRMQHGALISSRCSLARSYRFSSHLPHVRPRSVQLAPPRWRSESEGVLLHTSSVANGLPDGPAPSSIL